MPPEPLPWDRKDFFKERKHERSEFLGPVSRWRDSSNHGSREFSRWGSGDFRRPPGHGRQGSWHLFSDEYGHGYGPSLSFSNKMLENVSNRQTVSHGEGKYARNGRESRSFSHRDWKGHSCGASNGSMNSGGRLQHDLNYDQKSVQDMFAHSSHSNYDYLNSRDKVKVQHDKVSDVNGLSTSHRRDRECSLSSPNWRPLKWTRSGGLSSRSSTSGHSSSSKSLDDLNPNDAKSEILVKNDTQNQSPSADPASLIAAPPFDEIALRKKPRLGWGEGLAKYEKKKVEIPDAAGFPNVDAESTLPLSCSLTEKGLRGSEFSDSASPATHSNVCVNSPGGGEKSSGSKADVSNDVSSLNGSPSTGLQNQFEGHSFNLEQLDNSADLSSPLIQMLQSNDSIPVDSNFMSSTAMDKLLTYKSEISKVLEMTESEIDLLENEYKGLRSDNRGGLPYPSASGALLAGDKYFEKHIVVSNSIPSPPTLQVVNSAESNSQKMAVCMGDLGEAHAESLDEDKSVNTGEKLSIPSCNGEDNIAASVDGNILVKRDAATSTPISCNMDEVVDEEDSVFDLILASNKESAYRASEALYMMLPAANEHKNDTWVSDVSCSQNVNLIKERFVRRKQFLRFKERVTTLKFKAFQALWKESLHVPPVRKLRAKSQKKYQLCSWSNHSGYQKSRSSIRSRVPSPAGNLNPVPITEIHKHISKQLSNPQLNKLYRDNLKMPAFILDQKDRIASVFLSNNGLVEDPLAVEQERTMINPWTVEEKHVFMDKLALFGKDFRKIASFLNHKTTADCIEFYYKNHKADCFEKTKKLKCGKKAKSATNSTFMVTTGKKWNPEMNSASRDLFCGRFEYRTSQGRLSEKAFDMLGNEREKVAADVLAGISGSLSSEAVGSCITSNFDRRDGFQDLKCRKGSGTILRWRMTGSVLHHVDEEVCSDKSCGETDPSYWTDGEKTLFIEAVTAYGKDFSSISNYVGTKSTGQCKVFFSKARKCLGLDSICTATMKHPVTGGDDISNRDRDGDSGNGEDGGDAKNGCRLDSGYIPQSGVVCQMVEVSPTTVEEPKQVVAINSQTAILKVKEDDDDDISLTFDVNSPNNKNKLSQDQQQPVAMPMIAETAGEPSISSVQTAVAYCGQPSLDVLDTSRESDAETERGEKRIVETSCNQGDFHCSMQSGKPYSHVSDNQNQDGVELGSSKNLCPSSSQPELRPTSRSLSDSEQSSLNSDVKLFGQILSHSSSKENGNGKQLHHKFKRKLKVSSHGSLSTANFNAHYSPNLKDVPSKSYGIWDGNRMHTGLSSLPDPAVFLATYPSAFDLHSQSSSEPLQKMVNGNEQKSTGDSQNSEASCSSGRITNYEAWIDGNGKKCHPSSDSIPEVRREGSQQQQQQGKWIIGELCNDASSSDTIKLQQHNNTEGGEPIGD